MARARCVVDGRCSESLVFGPNRVPTGAPTSADWSYASVTYFTEAGRTTNTALIGAGEWQIATDRHDEHGNVVRSLDVIRRTSALNRDGDTADAAEQSAAISVYDTEGSRVKESFGPTAEVVSADGTTVSGRARTEYIYDDEAVEEGVPTPGRPTEVPESGFGLVVEERHSVAGAAAPGASGAAEWDSRPVRYRYDPIMAGDDNGWELGTATRRSVEVTDGSWSTTLTRFDGEGKIIETRSPDGVQNIDGWGGPSLDDHR